MKSLSQFLTESRKFWTNKHISQNEILEVTKQALRNLKLHADKIELPLARYKDPDDAWDAVQRGEFPDYSALEAEVARLLDKNGFESSDIMDEFYWESYDILDALGRY